jgi:hypothetical protein
MNKPEPNNKEKKINMLLNSSIFLDYIDAIIKRR